MSSAQSSGAAAGGQIEDKIDLSVETATKIAQAQQLVSAGSSSSSLQDALAILAALEKRCRVGNDTPSLVKVCEASLEICHEASDSEALLATLKTLSTRRSQKSKAISTLVTKCLPWVVDVDTDGFTPLPVTGGDEASKAREALVEELRNITDGKMYLEAERARLTRTMAILKESAGDISAAADVLQEVHVETYGSISKREKIEFILEQMRLTLLKKDYVRAYIVSNKIKRPQLDEEGHSEMKVKFYSLLTKYYKHEKLALELAKCYHAIYSTPSVQEEESQWKEALTNTVVFLCLSEYSNEVKDMMERVNLDAKLEKIPECKETITCYLKDEIIHYPLPHQTMLESIPAFTDDSGSDNDDSDSTLKEHWHTSFHTRIIQHNLRVTSIYYRQIHTSRLAVLLSLTTAETEKHISQMVSNGTLYAKIDRPKDIVRFMKKRCEEEVLSDWAADIKTLLGLVDETTYLIHKENMVQSH
mmetsp:Transcript_22266/g.39999  ORF Transcript_22266/g.39999 Transcript_22266/m.39999 type:complete len:475 (-) Transcript_22266:233-1657(-)